MVTEMRAAVDRADERAKTSRVKVYSWSLFYCSVCAPKEMTAEDVEAETNLILICGTTKGWTISDEGKFSNGAPMPSECESDGSRRHWLLIA
jgi:hypothetical protein